MKILSTLFLILASNIALAQYYPTPEAIIYGEPGDTAAIDKLMDDFIAAWSGQDAAAVAAAHADDAEWINAFGRTFRGMASLEPFLRDQLFPNYPAEVSRQEMASFTETSRRYMGDDAVVIQAATNSGRGSAVSGDARKIFFTLVIGRTDAGWRIVHQTITDVRPLRD
jgi:uncharacterized protein (TIGR02246 family)